MVVNAAAVALGGIGPAAIQALTRALRNERWRVRRAAASALGAMRSNAAVAALALGPALRDDDARVRSEAAFAIGRLGEGAAAAIPKFLRALRDADHHVRGSAAAALGMVGPKAAVAIPDLRKAVRDPAGPVRSRALDALAGIDPAALPLVLAEGQDEDRDARHSATGLLARFAQRSKRARAALVEALGNDDGAMRCFAVRSLGQAGPAAHASIPALFRVIREGIWMRESAPRPSVVEAIAKIGFDAGNLTHLIDALEHDNPSIHAAAIDVAIVVAAKLGTGLAPIVPALQSLRESGGPGTRKRVAVAIEKITGSRRER